MLLHGPITFEVGMGRVEPGNWEEQGLSAYAGGVVYCRDICIARRSREQVWTDLRRVRGTVEVWVNGACVGRRIWSPYCFGITKLVREGENTIEARVFNTLAPYLAAVSPTYYIFPGQTISGLFGPITLIYGVSEAT